MKRIIKAVLFPSVLMVLFFFYSCRERPSKHQLPSDEDISAPVPDTFVFVIDSTRLNQIISAHVSNKETANQLRLFYGKRSFVAAWINSSGLNADAFKLMNLLDNEQHAAIPVYDDSLHQLFYSIADTFPQTEKDSLFNEVEAMLTIHFFEYGQRNWSGREDIRERIGWFIERKKINYNAVLDSILKGKDQSSFWFEPVNRQYGLLRNFVIKYQALLRQWPKWSTDSKLMHGDSAEVIPDIKKELFLLNDMRQSDESVLFDEAMEQGVKQFQLRNGIDTTGIIDVPTRNLLLVPPDEVIRQLLVNMERYKWVPVQMKGKYIAVNIPDFKLGVYNNDSLLWQTRIVVGKAATKTVIFNSDISEIIFRPYWTMPRSIFIKEALPSIRNSIAYLSGTNMQVIDGSGKIVSPSTVNWKSGSLPFTLRQRPGPSNSLGLVKFQLSNPYDIYLHDTPHKTLFSEKSRAFSHGCIRVEHADKLALLLLSSSGWDETDVIQAMNGSSTVKVRPGEKIPVFIAYFTAWVDRKGKLHLRKDIYNHDNNMKTLLFNGAGSPVTSSVRRGGEK